MYKRIGFHNTRSVVEHEHREDTQVPASMLLSRRLLSLKLDESRAMDEGDLERAARIRAEREQVYAQLQGVREAEAANG